MLLMMSFLVSAIAVDATDISRPDSSMCSNAANRTAILERGKGLLEQAQRLGAVPGAEQAKERAKAAADEVLKQIDALASAAKWSPEQKSDFAERVFHNPQERALQAEFSQDLLQMAELAPRLDTSDATG